MSPAAHHGYPHRVTKPFFTFGTVTLLILMGVGFSFGLTRMLFGLGSVTNLDDHNPWGIWIAFDVACGVALAAGGFTTAALVEIFGRRRYQSLLRPAILTAFLGYLWVAIALCFDLGRYWNIWRPIFNWQGNSVLFEVGMCVTAYLIVLSIEMAPSVLEGLKARIDEGEWGAALLRRVEKPLLTLYAGVRIILPLFILAGVVLSFMHQSSLGALMLITPSKLSALWNTPILPLLFLLSALMVGFPMVILESIYANISFGRDPEMELLTPMARMIPWFLGIYGIVKIGDRWCRDVVATLPAEWVRQIQAGYMCLNCFQRFPHAYPDTCHLCGYEVAARQPDDARAEYAGVDTDQVVESYEQSIERSREALKQKGVWLPDA